MHVHIRWRQDVGVCVPGMAKPKQFLKQCAKVATNNCVRKKWFNKNDLILLRDWDKEAWQLSPDWEN